MASSGCTGARNGVLIAPLWNWNEDDQAPLSGPTVVLIAPLWNWNLDAASARSWHQCSNRTFMELKFVKVRKDRVRKVCSNRTFMELKFLSLSHILHIFTVLIAPLWNWNISIILQMMRSYISSNRTFMELKWLLLLLVFVRMKF